MQAAIRFRSVYALLAALVLLVGTVPSGAVDVNAQQAPRSRVVLDLPPAFVPSQLYSGFADDAIETSIVVNQLPVDKLETIKAAFAVEALKARGFADPATGSLPRGDDYLYVKAGQLTGEEDYAKAFLVFRDPKNVAVVTVNMPKRLIASGKIVVADIERILATARFTDTPLGPAGPARPGYLGPFQEVMTLDGQSTLFTLDGKPQRTNGERWSALMIAPSTDRRPVGDLAAFARASMSTLPDTQSIALDPPQPVKIGDLDAVEVTGRGTDAKTGEPVALAQTVIKRSAGGYVRVLLLAPEPDRDRLFAEFHKIVDGLAIEP